jgi:hypothetical protein
MPEQACLACGRMVDACTGIGNRHEPKAGDISICLYCGDIAAYGPGMRLRPLTDAEMHDIAGDRTIIAAQKARDAVFAGRR